MDKGGGKRSKKCGDDDEPDSSAPQDEGPSTTTKSQSAMMNDLILKHLFELSSLKDLHNYRQVCKHWNSVALPIWLKTGPSIAFYSIDTYKFSRFVQEVHLERGELVDADADHDSPQQILGLQQYRKFIIFPREFLPHHLTAFWNGAGSWLTHLTVGHLRFKSNDTNLNNILICKYTPNLESLDVRIKNSVVRADDGLVGVEFHGQVLGSPTNKNLKTLKMDASLPGNDALQKKQTEDMNWKSFLSLYPELEHLAVGSFLSGYPGEIGRILEAIKEIRAEDSRKLRLKSLLWFDDSCYRSCSYTRVFEAKVDASLVKLSRECQLPVQEYKIDFSKKYPESEELVHNLLEIHAKCLKKLEFHIITALSKSPFLNMGHLQSLTLTGYPVKSLLFLKDLGSLRTLCLWGDLNRPCEEYARRLISETDLTQMTSFPSLTQFCCNYYTRWSVADVAKLGGMMPALVRLEMKLSDETFRLVCQLWPRLEHLGVYWGDVGDAGIAGLVKEEGEEGNISYTLPNITCLLELRSFSIEGLDLSCILPDLSFTSQSVTHGLMRLRRRLEKLVINVFQMSSQVEELLAQTFPSAKITTGGGFMVPRWF